MATTADIPQEHLLSLTLSAREFDDHCRAEARAMWPNRPDYDAIRDRNIALVRWANPDAAEADVVEAGITMAAFHLHACLQHDGVGYGAKVCLKRYAAAVKAQAETLAEAA